MLALAVLWSGLPFAHAHMAHVQKSGEGIAHSTSHDHHAHHSASLADPSEALKSDERALFNDTIAAIHCNTVCTFAALPEQKTPDVIEAQYFAYEAVALSTLTSFDPALLKRPPKA